MPMMRFTRRQIWDGRGRNIGDMLNVETRFVEMLKRLGTAELVSENPPPSQPQPQIRGARGDVGGGIVYPVPEASPQFDANAKASAAARPSVDPPLSITRLSEEEQAAEISSPAADHHAPSRVRRGSPAPQAPAVVDEKRKRDDEAIERVKERTRRTPPTAAEERKRREDTTTDDDSIRRAKDMAAASASVAYVRKDV